MAGPLIPAIASGLGAIGSIFSGSSQRKADARQAAAELALRKQEALAQQQQFQQNLAEQQRQANMSQSNIANQFAAGQENTMFGRAENARRAQVTSPLIAGLLAGRQLKTDPTVQRMLAAIPPAPETSTVLPRPKLSGVI